MSIKRGLTKNVSRTHAGNSTRSWPFGLEKNSVVPPAKLKTKRTTKKNLDTGSTHQREMSILTRYTKVSRNHTGKRTASWPFWLQAAILCYFQCALKRAWQNRAMITSKMGGGFQERISNHCDSLKEPGQTQQSLATCFFSNFSIKNEQRECHLLLVFHLPVVFVLLERCKRRLFSTRRTQRRHKILTLCWRLWWQHGTWIIYASQCRLSADERKKTKGVGVFFSSLTQQNPTVCVRVDNQKSRDCQNYEEEKIFQGETHPTPTKGKHVHQRWHH